MGTKRSPGQPRTREVAKRNAEIYNAVRVNGERLAAVADRYDVSQPRVSQIVNDPDSHLYV